MNWYSGSIPEAIAEAKNNNKIFLVYIEGNDDLSKSMTVTYNDPAISGKLNPSTCVALKLTAQSRLYEQFSEIYPVVVIPSSFFIGRHGMPIEIVTGSLAPNDFLGKIEKIFEQHKEESSASCHSNAVVSPSFQQAMPSCSTSGSELSQLPLSSNNASCSSVEQQEVEDSDSSNVAARSCNADVSPPPHQCLVTCPSPESTASEMALLAEIERSIQYQEPPTPSLIPTLEERVKRANALIEQKRVQKEIEEKEREKLIEQERRKSGKALQMAHQTRQEAELKAWAESRAKEKEEERLAKERVRAQIAQDRADRAAKYDQSKVEEQAIQREQENARLREVQERGARDAAQRSSIARLQFRLPDGSSVTHQFPADSTLNEAREFVLNEIRPSFTTFSLCTTFPRRQFTENNFAESLRDLQLAPSATLLILPVRAVANVANDGSGFVSYILWTLLTPLMIIWRTITAWFGGSSNSSGTTRSAGYGNNRAQSSSHTNPNLRESGAEGQTARKGEQDTYRRDGNVFQLRSQSNDEDENNTWNGNSTQQM